MRHRRDRLGRAQSGLPVPVEFPQVVLDLLRALRRQPQCPNCDDKVLLHMQQKLVQPRIEVHGRDRMGATRPPSPSVGTSLREGAGSGKAHPPHCERTFAAGRFWSGAVCRASWCLLVRSFLVVWGARPTTGGSAFRNPRSHRRADTAFARSKSHADQATRPRQLIELLPRRDGGWCANRRRIGKD